MNEYHLEKIVVFLLLGSFAFAQQREVNHQGQFWLSINSTTRINDTLGWVGDFHTRRNNFLEDPSFNFLRVGPYFWITDRLTFTLGYAHMWKAVANGQAWTGEDRIYQQLQYSTKVSGISLLQRIRNEQRWQDQIKEDVSRGGHKLFSNRVRYLLSFTIPVSSNPAMPALMISDEILLQFGRDIVNNTFDQNRFFVGIKKSISPSWSFDMGYMPVYQQRPSGYQYDLNHTLRCFFYFTPDLRKVKSRPHEPGGNEE